MDSSVLEFIDSLPWSEVAHAYGIADDGPRELRRLLSEDVDERMDAICGFLYSSAYHQYSICTATPFMMQCVLKLLEVEGMPERDSGMGGPTAYDLLHFIRICAEQGQKAINGQPHVTAPTIEEAALSGLSLYQRYAVHPHSKVREEALQLLSIINKFKAG